MENNHAPAFSSPWEIQRFLSAIPYNSKEECKSPKRVLAERNAHCFEGALFAASRLRELAVSGVKPGSIAHMLVELSRDDQTVRRSTDMNGEFVFDNIRPGSWNLKFYEAGLPTGYRFETESKTIELAPGDTVEMVNLIFPKKRTIQFIDSGTVTTSSSGKKK